MTITVQASKIFGSICSAIAISLDFSLEKRFLYHSVVLRVLLYGAETWTPTQVLVEKLELFQWCCVHCIMGVGKAVHNW